MANSTTNTNGMITAATQEQMQQAKSKVPKTPAAVLNTLLNNATIQEQLKSTLRENSGAFATSIMNVFQADGTLQQCDPKLVLKEALKGAALKLPIEKQLGFSYIIPFRNHGVMQPQFQIGYKGYIQLAMRTGAYKYINADKVYEGELKSVDKLTGEIDISGEKTSDKVVGYFAYIETITGFKKTFYWDKERVTAHAQRYSKNFNGAIWKTNFDEMAIKTVLRNLLSHYGVMSVEMNSAFSSEAFSAAAPTDQTDNEIPAELSEIKPTEETGNGDFPPLEETIGEPVQAGERMANSV